MTVEQAPVEAPWETTEWVETLLEHARTGTVLDLSRPGVRPDPARADEWPASQRLPAEALRAALIELARTPDRADPRGLRIVAADLADTVDLANLRLAFPLRLTACRLQAGLVLTGSTLVELVLDGSDVTGEIRAIHAQMSGMLSLRGATLSNANRRALSLDQAQVGGHLLLDEGFRCSGEVCAAGAVLGSTVSLRRATLKSPNRAALVLDDATIAGDLLLDRDFAVLGEVGVRHARIGGRLGLGSATLVNGTAEALSLEGSHISVLELRGLRSVTGQLVLARCRIDELVTDDGVEPPPGVLIADDWQLDTVRGRIAIDAALATTWLDSRPFHLPYTPAPARMLADVLERTGQPDQARRLRLTAAQRVARHAPWRSRIRRQTWGLLVGHGYRPARPLWWLLAVVAIAAALATTQASAFLPTDPARAVVAAQAAAPDATIDPATLTGATQCAQLGTYPCFAPIGQAIQTMLPLATAVQPQSWAPTGWVALALGALRVSALALVTLLLAGLAGLLRRP